MNNDLLQGIPDNSPTDPTDQASAAVLAKRDTAVLTTRDLVLATGTPIPDFAIGVGLTMVRMPRERSATVLALTLAGRMKPKSGSVVLRADGANADVVESGNDSAQYRFDRIAIAGVPAIDSLERLIPARSVIREQAAWSSPWYRTTPSTIDKIDSYVSAARAVSLDLDNETARRTPVGQLGVLDRLKLRTVLALMARPERELLIVDDIDQLRDLDLRDEFVRDLRTLSTTIPVVVFSANPDTHRVADHCEDLGVSVS